MTNQTATPTILAEWKTSLATSGIEGLQDAMRKTLTTKKAQAV